MSKYVLLSYLPAGGEPAVEAVGGRWQDYRKAMEDAGVLLSHARLAGTHTSTTVRTHGDEPQIIDGPFAETKEYLAGFFLIEVADLDEALAWASRMPNGAYGPVEVRPVWGA